MPILEDFCKGDKKPIGKIMLDDGENYHWVWPSQAGTGDNKWDASTDEKVLADYKKHGEKMVKLGITGTMVANDWDVCVADGACMTTSGTKNPSLTFMAITARAATYAVEQLKNKKI